MSFRTVRNLGSIPTDTFDRRQEKVQLLGHTETVRWVSALSSKSVITASRDATLKLWNIETGECEATFEGHTKTVRSVARHSDLVVSASYDHDARIWSLQKKECLHVLRGHVQQLFSVAFDGQRIVTGSLDKTARVWDPNSGYVPTCCPSSHREESSFEYTERVSQSSKDIQASFRWFNSFPLPF